MFTKRFALLPVAAAVLLVTALAFGACGDDDNDDAAGAASGGNSAVMSAIVYLDTAGLHDIDVAISEEATVPPTARTVMLKSATVLKLTEWPSEVSALAADLATTMEELAAVLDEDPVDMARASELAARVHDDEHDLSHDVWAHLQAEAGVGGGGDSHD